MPRKKFPHLKLVDPATLPELVIYQDNPNVTARALARLIAQQDNIFRHQGEPARLDVDEDGEPKLVVLDFMDIIELGYELTHPVKQTSKGPRGAPIQHDVGKLALKKLQSTETALRPLDGFCTMPLLLDDGAINAAHGYHKPSRLYCHRLPDIDVPDRPTRADAEAALLQLRRPFRTFPFADADMTKEKVMIGDQATELQVVNLGKTAARDESAFLTMLMTSVCRRSLKLAPALALTSPKFSGAGTGKGLSIRALSIVATGNSAHVNSLGRGDEMEKGIVAALLQPDPIISLDNLNNVLLRSPALCTALTESPARLRPLGSSENREINTRAFIALNGNGLGIGEDLVRRVVIVELDAKVENPELRSFPGNFLADIAEARPQLLGEILTIWRWGRQNGDQLSRGLALGSYSQWAEWVRDVLLTLGCCDPVERVETAKANDAGRLYTLGIFEAWEEQFKGNEKTSKDAYDNDRVRAAIEGGQQLTRQKFANKLFGLIGVRLGGYVMRSPNKAEKERPENKKRMRFVSYTYQLESPSRDGAKQHAEAPDAEAVFDFTGRPSESKRPLGLSPRAVDQLARELSDLKAGSAAGLEATIRSRLSKYGVPVETRDIEVKKIVRRIEALEGVDDTDAAHGANATAPAPYQVLGPAPIGERCDACGNAGGVNRIELDGTEYFLHVACADSYLAAMADRPVKIPEWPDPDDEKVKDEADDTDDPDCWSFNNEGSQS